MNTKHLLTAGDILVVAIVTVIGFATHGQVGTGAPSPYIVLPRMLAAFVPLAVAWFLLAPWFGLFQAEITSDPKLLWRPVLAMLLAAPFAAVLRGLILNAPIIPIFAVVLSTTSAFGMLIWRGIYIFIGQRKS